MFTKYTNISESLCIKSVTTLIHSLCTLSDCSFTGVWRAPYKSLGPANVVLVRQTLRQLEDLGQKIPSRVHC